MLSFALSTNSVIKIFLRRNTIYLFDRYVLIHGSFFGMKWRNAGQKLLIPFGISFEKIVSNPKFDAEKSDHINIHQFFVCDLLFDFNCFISLSGCLWYEWWWWLLKCTKIVLQLLDLNLNIQFDVFISVNCCVWQFSLLIYMFNLNIARKRWHIYVTFNFKVLFNMFDPF